MQSPGFNFYRRFDAEFGNALSGVVNIITKSGTTDHTISAQVESDSWIPTKINKQQNKFISFETAFSGPIISDQLSYFLRTIFL